MKSKNIRLALWVILSTFSLFSFANTWSYSVDYIRGEGDVEGIKLAGQYHTDYLRKYYEHIDLYFESSVNFWEYGAEDNYDTNFVLAISPVIHYPIGTYRQNPVYIEFGIGLSILSDTEFAGKDVSTHYQFEDRLGIVMKFGKNNAQQLALRYFHYSNAGFKKPNPGLDFISLSYTKYLF